VRPPRPADWGTMTKVQKRHWYKQGDKRRSQEPLGYLPRSEFACTYKLESESLKSIAREREKKARAVVEVYRIL